MSGPGGAGRSHPQGPARHRHQRLQDAAAQPDIASVWLDLVNVVRWKVDLDGRLREIVIVRIGYLNRCAYVVNQHVPELTAPEGLSKEECAALADWRASAFFNERERAALAYADAMTRDIDVPEAVFAELRKHFNERQIVELTVLIGTYNMHTPRRPGAADRSRTAPSA